MTSASHLRRLGAVIAVGSMLALAGCATAAEEAPAASSDETAPEELYTLTVSSQPLSHIVPLVLGQEQGFFEANGIDLQLDTENAEVVGVPATVSGQVDISNGDLVTLLTAKSQGLAIEAILPASASTGVRGEDYGALIVPAGSPITSPAELEGKTVSSNSLTNIAALAVRESVTADGGDADAINLVEVPFPDVPAALSTGKVDASWVVEPFLTASLAQGATAIGWGFEDISADLTVSAWFTSEAFAAENPTVVAGFKKAVQESYAYAAANEDEVRATIVEVTSIPEALAPKITLTAWKDEIDQTELENLITAAESAGLLEKKVDLDEFLFSE